MQTHPNHSTPHSILCNFFNAMLSHSSWASQLSRTRDLDIAVEVDSVSCDCSQKWVRGNLVSYNCNKNGAIVTKLILCEKQPGIV